MKKALVGRETSGVLVIVRSKNVFNKHYGTTFVVCSENERASCIKEEKERLGTTKLFQYKIPNYTMDIKCHLN